MSSEHPEHLDEDDQADRDVRPPSGEITPSPEIPPVVLAIGRLAVREQVALG